MHIHACTHELANTHMHTYMHVHIQHTTYIQNPHTYKIKSSLRRKALRLRWDWENFLEEGETLAETCREPGKPRDKDEV